MLEPDLIELFVGPLNRMQFRYLVSGSVAAMLYGEPRVTHDIDMIVFLRPEDVLGFNKAFPAPDFYVPPREAVVTEISRERGQFNVIHPESGLKADIYPAGRDELHAWAFRNARQYSIGNTLIRLAPPEYVIVRKLEYFREGGSDKHLRDIRSMLAVSGDQINQRNLNEWVKRLGLEAQWKLVSP